MPYRWTVLLGLILAGESASAQENLAVDASFESPLPAWFAERAGTSYYAAKEPVTGAADGKHVLAIAAWEKQGSRILSGPVALRQGRAQSTYSAAAQVRSFGKPHGATIELALMDEKGTRQLASFGRQVLDGKGPWATLAGRGVTVDAPSPSVRLALILNGPSEDTRVEVDQVGLFEGNETKPVSDNSDLAVIEAESLADGRVWKAVEHYPGWYNGMPSGMRMLAGSDPIPPAENKPAVHRVKLGQAGPHRLWVRFHSNAYADQFTLAVRQAGQTIGERTIHAADEKYPRWAWSWESLDTQALKPGDAEIVLSRPPTGTSGHARKLDLLVLTNRLDYVPAVEHFRPQGFLRFVNLSADQAPFCLWIFIRRHQGPHWYANPGMLTRAGLSESYYVPADQGKWIAPGQSSPWVRISDYLLAAGGRNNVQLLATRKMHTDGFVRGRIRGRLEFADGQRSPIKSIDIDQDAPRILLTLPYDLPGQRGQIKSPRDYIRETEAEIAKLGPAKGTPASHLNLAANVSLRHGTDDPAAVRGEIEILKRLGFNQTYRLIAPPDQALAFSQQHGLLPRFGEGLAVWSLIEGHSQHHPKVEAMAKVAAKFADDHRPLLGQFVRCNLMDEPGGMSYQSIVQSEPCRRKFVEWLKEKKLTPADVGVKHWDEALPVTPKESQAKPELFYYSGLFRLEAFATLARACVAAKKTALPDTALTYVNYSPPNSGGSWTERGTDLFLAHGAGGMEMVWTEDWLGYSVGPQHLSDILALCRAAGRSQQRRIGAYWVGDNSPLLMRMKFYTLVAGGARDIQCYDYGPWYAGIDSWGRRFELYPAIRDCNFQIGTIDKYLDGATRRKSDVAILYNRTAAMWADTDNSCAMNASFTHWALAHAGYDADFLAEEDVERGELARYKALYLDGPQLRRQAAQAIAGWVGQGGVLCGSTGAGSRDQFNRPLETLEPVFAARSKDLLRKATAGRPKYELRSLKALDRLAAAPQSAEKLPSLDQLCYREQIEALPGAEVVLANKEGRPAGTVHRHGRGTAIRLAALAGMSYVHEAVQPPYDPDSYLPTQFRGELRDLIAGAARRAGVSPIASCDSPIAEIIRYDAADRAVVFVIDHRGKPAPRFTFELTGAGEFTRAIAATGTPVEVRRNEGKVSVSLALDVCDALVLLK